MRRWTERAFVLLWLGGMAVSVRGGEQPRQIYRGVPNCFIPNTPHVTTGHRLVEEADVSAFIQTRHGRVLFSPGGAFIGFTIPATDHATSPAGHPAPDGAAAPAPSPAGELESRSLAVMSTGFGQALRRKTSPALLPRLEEPLSGTVNFFTGTPENWQTGIPAYRKLVYENVWPGIDVEFSAGQDWLEYRLILHPGASLADAVMETGAATLDLDGAGNLTACLAGAALRMSRPLAWQEVEGRSIPVEIHYQPLTDGRYGFVAGGFDPDRELFINPVLNWSTYLGPDGSPDGGPDEGKSVAVDAAGNAYLTGYTESSSFPVTAGVLGKTSGGGADVFVTKLNATGTTLLYSTYLGGSGYDEGNAIAVDAAGQAYLTGSTESPNFPVTPGAMDTTYNGNIDAFALKLNSNGSQLIYSTFIGEGGFETGKGIAANIYGNAFVTGYTGSSAFPTTQGSFGTTFHGGFDVFVVKLGSNGSTAVYSSLAGGTGNDYAEAIAVDATGHAWLTGSTASAGFPATTGAYEQVFQGSFDLFVTRVNPAGSALIFSTFIGGSDEDRGYDIALDADGNGWITGSTRSPDFPVTAGAFDTSANGREDAFVTRLSATGARLDYSTLLGGNENDTGFGIALDTAGHVYLTGITRSNSFPATDAAFDPVFNGVPVSDPFSSSYTTDVFVTKLNPAESRLVYSTFLGGSGPDGGQDIAVDAAGNAYVTGFTGSFDFPVTAGVFDTARNSFPDAFVTKLNPAGSSLAYSTYLGGKASGEYGQGIATDGSSHVYVTGYTFSGDFPVTTGVYASTHRGYSNVFVTKLNYATSGLIYSTFLGGGNNDRGYAIAVDSSGQAYITGSTNSSQFPVTPGAFDTAFAEGYDPVSRSFSADVFVTKLNTTGSSLIYSTLLGGLAEDSGNSIAVDADGNALITGFTFSADFPTTAGALDTSFNGHQDTFVTKLNTSGSALIFSTFLGGTSADLGSSIAIDTAGNTFVTGSTFSTDFPVTGGGFDTSFSGYRDAFVSKLDPSGATLVFSTYLGGSQLDNGVNIALDQSGNAFVRGYTASTDFPVTEEAFDQTPNGSGDVFVTRLNPDGSALVYSTFLGSSGDDRGAGLAVDAAGNAYLTGRAGAAGFPVVEGAYSTEYHGEGDIFVTKLSNSGNTLDYSTLIGGSKEEWGSGITLDGAGNVYVTGTTWSADFPVTAGVSGPVNMAGPDVLVIRLIFNETAPAAPSGLTARTVSGTQVDLTWEDNSNNEDGFLIERSAIPGSGWIQLAIPGVNATSYQNKGLRDSARYCYRVRAFNQFGNSDYSPEACAAIFSRNGNFTIGGYLGTGLTVPERAIHIRGSNAVFRMDRNRDTAAFMIVRNDTAGDTLKTYVVGVNAAEANLGSFVINDLGQSTTGGGSNRLTIVNEGQAVFGQAVRSKGFITASSQRWKTNIRPLDGPLATLRQLQGYRFDWKETGEPATGFIAEEVAESAPLMVNWSGEERIQKMELRPAASPGFRFGMAGGGRIPAGIDYAKLTAVLLESIKAQQEQIEALKARRDRLQSLREELQQLHRR